MTAKACRDFYNSLRLLPTILQGDLETVDSSLEIFGTTLDIPVLLAPTAFHNLACPDGEIATAKGASAAGAGYSFNFMLSSKLYTDVLRSSRNGVKWLHKYMFEEKDLVKASIEAALGTDAFSAIILTCDHPHTQVQGRMLPFFTKADFPYTDLDDPFFPNQAALGFDDVTLRQLTDPEYSLQGNPGGTNSSKLSWKDVKEIQSMVNGSNGNSIRRTSAKQKKKIPIVAKGI